MRMEFVEFKPVYGEKHVGIATVRFGDPGEQIYLKFKVMPSQKGAGYYCVGPSFKIGEEYTQAIMLDSNWMKEQMDSMIRKAVRESLNEPQKTQHSASIFKQEDRSMPSGDEEIPF